MKYLTVLAFVLVVCGCGKKTETKTMPELNAENCKPENIEKIEPKEIREQFSDMCLRQGSFQPSKPKVW